jgi:copper chaperone NosL
MLAAATAVAGLGFVLAVVLWPAGRGGPEPIAYGRDTCGHCRMHLARPGFAAKTRDPGGALATYDDLGCLLAGMASTRDETAEAWVEDHHTGELVPLRDAHLVRAERVRTPMGSGVVAFKDAATAETFAGAQGGQVVSLETLTRRSSGSGEAEATR